MLERDRDSPRSAIACLKQLVLSKIDRMEMDYLLTDLEHAQQRILELEKVIVERCGDS